MANEISLTASLAFAKGNFDSLSRSRTMSVNVTGARATHVVQSVNTAEEAMTLGDVSAGGYCWVRNLDATNYVEIRGATGDQALIRLKAGEVALFRLSAGATAPFVIANTAACNIEIFLIED